MPTTNSPLRYPGGKTAIAPFLRSVIQGNGLGGGEYVEPYAGGAGAALALLFDNTVGSVHINDKDPHIHAFWKSILVHTSAFLERLEATDVTMSVYARQREIYQACDISDPLTLGFATFFLNRCNTSGVLTAGPIGGKEQKGKYKLDARFRKDVLRKKIVRIWEHRDRIHLTCMDALDVLRDVAQRTPEAFVYLDPPYYKKGRSLYLNYYDHRDHERLAETLQECHLRNWLISYDLAPEIQTIYNDSPENPNTAIHTLNYSLKTVRKGHELLVKSSALSWPVSDE